MDPQNKCYLHYRAAVATCVQCGRGLCEECAALRVDGHCVDCTDREHARMAAAGVQRDARMALRRAGVSVPRRSGDPVILRANGHPLVAGLCLAFAVVLAMGLGAAATVGETRWGIPRAAVAPALAIAAGTMVTGVFGGTSRLAGLCAVLLYLLAVASGPDALRMVASGVTLPGSSQAATWFESHHAIALVCYGVSAPLAYAAAAGRRVR